MCALVLAVASSAAAQGTAPTSEMEYKIKAAFLYNLAKYTQWPDERSSGPLVIGVVGEDPFGEALDALSARTANGRPLEIIHLQPQEDLGACHILFIAPSAQANSAEVLAAVAGTPVLTVSDVEGFPEAGGMVNLPLDDDQIRLEVNLDVALEAELRIGAKLLGLGTIVGRD